MHFPSCRVWDVNDGSLVNTLVHHRSSVNSLRFNSDTLVTGSAVLRILVPTYMHSSNQSLDFNSLLHPTYFKREVPITLSRYHVRVPLGRVLIVGLPV